MKKGKKLPVAEQTVYGVGESRENACFHSGTNPRVFDYLGAHPQANGHILFRIYAPNAEEVSVCGDFNEWDPARHPMKLLSDGAVWELSYDNDGNLVWNPTRIPMMPPCCRESKSLTPTKTAD